MLLKRSILIIGCTVMAMTITGLSASWIYAEGDIADTTNEAAVEIENFVWEGSEVLPDDVQGEDHHDLIAAIVNGSNGLNTPNSALNQQIDSRKNSWRSWDTFGSMDWRDEAAMNEMFNLKTQGLSFMLYFPDDQPEKQYLFTTSIDLGEAGWISASPNIPIGEYVYVVYRTSLAWNDETQRWEEEKTEAGYAKSAYYNNDMFGSAVRKCPAFDATSWQAGKLGTSRSNSVYTYVGQTTTAYVDAIDEPIYYDLTNSSAGTRKVTVYNEASTITILDKNGKKVNGVTINTVTTADGKQAVEASWSASSNTLYYIQLVGAKSMTFTVS